MSKSKPAKKEDHWKYTAGRRPFTLVAEERPDRGFQIYLRWNGTSGFDATGLYVRDGRGRLRGTLVKTAREAADKAQALLAAGKNPRDWRKQDQEREAPPATLAQGFRASLPGIDDNSHRGTLFPTRNRHSLDQRKAADYVEKHLGADTGWEDLTAGKIPDLWRGMARKHKSGLGPGFRTVERAVDILFRVWTHLRERHGEDNFPAVQRPSRMEERMHQDWEAITGERVRARRKERKKVLRYSKPELEKLFSKLATTHEVEVSRGRKHKRKVLETQPMCEPRVRLVVEIGAELRYGQVLRAMRSDLDLSHGTGAYGLGRFLGERLGAGRKEVENVDLHPELRKYIDEVLEHGYLSELEDAYKAGIIEDYPLYPGGKLVHGKVPLYSVLKYPKRHLSKAMANKFWREFEERVGVRHVRDRSFYGLRRGLTDVANDYSTDDRALDRLTGHLDSETRKEFYQDREREEDRARAAHIRRGMRTDLAGMPRADANGRGPESLDPGTLALLNQIQSLSPETRAKLLQLLKPEGADLGRDDGVGGNSGT